MIQLAILLVTLYKIEEYIYHSESEYTYMYILMEDNSYHEFFLYDSYKVA